MRSRVLILAALAAALAVPGWAQAPKATPVRVGGTIEAVDGQTLVVKTRDGAELKVALPAGVTINAVVKRTLADIKPGDFVGSGALTDVEGQLHAQEVHIFPEDMRGTGEGHRPWRDGLNSTMTNATVAGVALAAQGGHLLLQLKDATYDIEVGPETPIIGFVAGDISLVKPGVAVDIMALKQPDGSLIANRVTADTDHLRPPA